MIISFDDLKNADLVVDTVYEGGKVSGKGSEVLSKLMPNCSNSGGFRKVMRKDGSGLPAYVVLYTSMSELAWPDYLDEETILNKLPNITPDEVKDIIARKAAENIDQEKATISTMQKNTTVRTFVLLKTANIRISSNHTQIKTIRLGILLILTANSLGPTKALYTIQLARGRGLACLFLSRCMF